ncbi:hypothetical protein ACFLZX_00820, partial [Nanoarchaeota archaeon]
MEEHEHNKETQHEPKEEHKHEGHKHEEHKQDEPKHEAHEEHSVHRHVKKAKSLNVWKVATVVLAVILIVVLYRGPSSDGGVADALSGEEVGDKTVEYVNTNLLQGQGTATVNSVEEAGNLYKLQLSVNGQDIDSYATKDGKLFFPQAFDLDEELEVPEPPAPT